MAKRPPKFPHLVGTNKILLLEDEYAAIGDTCGITKITGAPPADAETGSIRQMTKNGTIRRAKVKTSDNKIHTIYMVAANCPQVGALVSQTLGGLAITNAWFPQKITLA